jgi:antibiotic biosynthesis monooxygenase (ABM) superfamily enzyme
LATPTVTPAATDSAPATSAGAVTLVTQTRVRPERADDFGRWQERMNSEIAKAPGFIDRQVLPPTSEQPDWVIIQRFASLEAARAWLGSPEREHQIAQIHPWLIGHDDVHLIQGDADPGPEAPVSVVVSTRVKAGQEEAFRTWQRQIAAVEAGFPGYQGYKLVPPVPGVQDDWLTILRFDTEEHLQAWLSSPQRQQLLKEGEAFTAESHMRTVRTGFDAWFKLGSGAVPPPAWKQNMLVLLALYPVVFLFGLWVSQPILVDRLGTPFWLALFIGNIASVLLLGQIVPRVSHRFNWWINPAGDPTRVNLTGVAVIVALYGLFLLLFSQLA